MVDYKSKKILLDDQTSGLIFSVWPFIQKLMSTGFLISATPNTIQHNNWLLSQRLVQNKEATTFDLKIVFSPSNTITNKPKTIACCIENKAGILSSPDPQDTLEQVISFFTIKDMSKKNVLITAGPTAEDLDPVRFITNRSTGKMGLALAKAASNRGANVTVIMGPTYIKIPGYLNVINIRSAQNMLNAVKTNFPKADYYFSAAAIADYTPVFKKNEKIKKSIGTYFLELKRTTDILEYIGKNKTAKQIVIGFSLETDNLIENSLEKMKKKKLDMIVANNPNDKGAGFAVETNKVHILFGKEILSLPVLSKLETANRILDTLLLLDKNELR